MMADVSALDNTLTLDFWNGVWEKYSAPWQEENGNKLIWKHLSKILTEKLPDKKPEQLKVFVPLCGKAKDMYLFYQMGCTVVGVEFAKQGIDEFFAENNIEESEESNTPFRASKDGRMIIGQGDLFTFSGDKSKQNQLPFEKFDVILDRGSFEAINMQERGRYAELLVSLMADDGIYLINTMKYDRNEYGGPPLAADTEDLRAVFGTWMDITLVEELEDDREMWRELGISKLFEQLHLMTIKY